MPRKPRSAIGLVIYEREVRNWHKVRKYAIKCMREGENRSQLAYRLGVSTGFLSKWWAVWETTKTWESLKDRSSRPKAILTKKWQYAERIIAFRKDHPESGAQKIKVCLGIDLSHQSIYEILVAAGFIEPGPKARRVWRAFARHHSNSMWQMDFKDLKPGGPFLFSVLDDHSRMILASKVLENATTENALYVLRIVIRMFGKPRQILTDHGCQFFANKGGLSDFDVWCKENGIHHIMAGIRKPTTIGKVERWHRTLIDEFLCQFTDISEFRRRLPDYLEWYNTGRPHWGIGLRIPAEVYFADFIIPEDFAPGASVHEVP
jgi:transposase InsO family protein